MSTKQVSLDTILPAHYLCIVGLTPSEMIVIRLIFLTVGSLHRCPPLTSEIMWSVNRRSWWHGQWSEGLLGDFLPLDLLISPSRLQTHPRNTSSATFVFGGRAFPELNRFQMKRMLHLVTLFAQTAIGQRHLDLGDKRKPDTEKISVLSKAQPSCRAFR